MNPLEIHISKKCNNIYNRNMLEIYITGKKYYRNPLEIHVTKKYKKKYKRKYIRNPLKIYLTRNITGHIIGMC